MSSYLVAHETIDRILIYEYKKNHKLSIKDLTLVGRKLLKMNCLALKYRYNQKLNPSLWCRYEFNPYYDISDVQSLKSLDCLLYQCSEGDIYKNKFFNEWCGKSLERAKRIVQNSFSYQKAEWY